MTPTRLTVRGARRRGFTLIELSVALAIVVVLFGALVFGIGALTGSQAKSTASELAGVIRSLYDTAALSGKTCRLVFELPAEKDDAGQTKYWAECASGNLTAQKNRADELKEATLDLKTRREARGATSYRYGGSSDPSLAELMQVEKDRVDGQAKYSSFTSPEIEPRTIPGAVQLSVWTRHQREPVKEGVAYLYFFPQGFTERAQVYVRQGKNVWTLKVSPLTGKTSVVPEALEVPRS